MVRRALLPIGFAVIVFLLYPVSGAVSQEEEGAPAAVSAEELKGRLLAAMDALDESGFSARGSVAVQQAEPLGGMGGGGRAVVVAGGAQSQAPYEGEIEGWVDPEGTIVVLSKKAVPGFEAYRSQEREITRLTYEEEPPSVDQAVSDIEAILDMGNLRRSVRKADLAMKVDEGTGTIRCSGEVSRRLVPSRGGGAMGLMRAKVLEVEISLEVSGKGVLTKAEVRVVRSDPMASMMRGRMGFGRLGAGVRPSAEEGDEDKEGSTSVYRFTFSRADPSPRATAFRRSVGVLTGKGK